MNVLIVKLSPIYGLNSSMLRSLALTKGLLSLGYSIDFITTPINEAHTVYEGYDFFSKINIIELKGNSVYNNLIKGTKKSGIKKEIYSLARKIYHDFTFFDHTKSIAEKIKIDDLPSRKYDLVISISDPKTSHMAVNTLARQGLEYSKWIQYWGDPLALDISHTNKLPLFINKQVENKLFYDSDLILYASPVTLQKQKELFKHSSPKMKFIPTPYIEKKLYPRTNNEKFQLGYFGDYVSKTRNIKPLYDASLELKEIVDLTVVGNTDINFEPTENIHFYERQEIAKFEANTDLLVCMLNKKGTQIPGKIFHYASTNKPILLILDGEYGEEIGEYFKKLKRYYICSNNKEEIKEKINVIKNDSSEQSPLDAFSPTDVAKKILDIAY